ncbi:hypothetical protein J5226_12940 [Lysobacter sp. K5869]|uniref:hypothetical protein n=1 Tax=Lysobacter sp. K5869 TaxID=2820808 RepID=UPI001C060D15|nr:hypothetical protein [Lysobacter sp. K5869]QWP79231.1 hypothetical protein J5226_12940 [Lysobacter sp. K5869]
MGVVTAAAIGAVGAVGGAMIANKGAKDAARASGRAADAGLAEQRAAREQFQQNITPYLNSGNNALMRLQAVNDGNYTDFYNAPDYKAAQEQGTNALLRAAAARGGLRSGGTDADLMRFGQNLAAGQLGNYRNALMGLAQMGQNAATGAGALGQQNANAMAGLYGAQGQAGSDAAINKANVMGNALQGLTGLAGQYMANRQSAYGSNNQIGAVTRQPIALQTPQIQIPKYRYG